MNSIHDMGGMQNMGPIAPEANEPVFRANWERRMFAMGFAVDETNRYAIELIPPADYLRMSYYERWLVSLIETLKKIGVLSSAEIASGQAGGGPIKGRHVLSLAELATRTSPGFNPRAQLTATAQFQVGQRVRARNINPMGHTRLPRFARGKLGTIERNGGAQYLQDTDAQGHSEKKPPQHVYCVRFTARELWGEQANPRDSVCVDLWEDYLEAA